MLSVKAAAQPADAAGNDDYPIELDGPGPSGSWGFWQLKVSQSPAFISWLATSV